MAQGEACYERNPNYIYRRIVDESVLVPIHQDVADMDCIYTLNDVAAFVWERLEQPATQAELEVALLQEYAADPEVLAADLAGFLQEMMGIGAIRKV